MTADPNITPRLQQILLFMLPEDKVYAVNQLADAISVSRRTMQRELNYIEQALQPYDLKFCSRTGTGVWIEGSQERKAELLAALQQTDVVDTSDRIQRRKRLILEILKDRDPKKLYYYSNLLGVSEATIASDLEAVEAWFASFRLQIIKRPGYGVTIAGSEKDYRLAMRSFIEENIDSQLLQDFYENKNRSVLQMFGEKNDKNIYAILDNDILKRVVSCLLSLNDKRILSLTENSYIGLVLHITIAINRILKQEIIESNEYLMTTLNRDEDYQFAVYITKMLEKEFDVVIPEIEAAYICLHIQGAKRQYSESDLRQHTMADENKELVDIAYQMIDAYDEELSLLLRQDEEFIRGLLAHLQPTFVRLKNNMKITNPLLDQIKKDYAAIFAKCRNVAALLAEWMQCEVPEAETGFLAIHFGAAVVRLEQQAESRRKVKVGIVCASGIGISRLMATKVRRHFLNRVELHTYGKTDLSPDVRKRMDFFISTVMLTENESDIIYVSPLLSGQDLDEMERRVQKYEKIPEKKSDETGEEQDEFAVQLVRINYVAEQIKYLIRDFSLHRVDDKIEFDVLVKQVSQELAVDEKGTADIERALFAREQSGSQIFAQFGFALLHTKTAGVSRPRLAIWLPEGAAQFSQAYFKGTGAAIVMLFPEAEYVKENRALLGYISEKLVEDPELFDTIIGGEEEAIREQLAAALKAFFTEYISGL